MNHSRTMRFLVMLLAVVMVIGYMPVAALATETGDEGAALQTATVHFDVNGGVGEYEDQVVTLGEKVTEPELDPTYESYEFAYWTADLEENVAWNFEEDVVTEDMTLYAAWTAVDEAGDEIPAEGEEEANSEDETSGEGESDVAAIAEEETNEVVYKDGKFGYNGYYNVISRKDWTLVPGAAIEYEIVLNNAGGTRRQVIHVIEVAPSNPDVSIVPGYYQIDKDLENEANWSHKELTEMAKYYENTLGYNIVGGMNTDLYYSSYSPRVLVYNGQWIGNAHENVATGGAVLNPTSSILYVFKDAAGNVSCDVKAYSKADVDKYLADGTLLHAVGVSFGMVVKDGKLVSTTEKRGSDDAARSMVGVKADGTLVICMNDGRGANNSVGFSSFEEGEAMLALGCQWAANCDGGGSSTFLTNRVG